MDFLFSSQRLGFRRVTERDAESLHRIVSDPEIMYAWGHTFSRHEVKEVWIDHLQHHYKKNGYSYFAAIEQASDRFIGIMGPLREHLDGQWRIGLGYILHKDFWHFGYATEGAGACMAYAFTQLDAPEVYAQIRPDNHPSIQVAQRLGMTQAGCYDRLYRGEIMPHVIYRRSREDWLTASVEAQLPTP